MNDLQSNHKEFMLLARELHDTQDSDRAKEINLRLEELNREYFGTFPNSEPLKVVAK